ncbi:NIPSNAP family protein [Phytomonospora endophytica]|uniref:NIPSNAP domain-containing protein n=1 Tax=Phytomonospora endophytica TaxID=714109 RepID=A0A841FIZ6_9ACTN|nr:NIPSNAP family protein [Phytomonospora endophytica]MBB6037301.1 hypothetical protein [Phytomonospora endophytica]GIG69955.1 hypothetical protein Pen01_62500 [Phytomonospora endophytica]
MIVEIRTYRLKPGTGPEFARLMAEEARPLLADAGIRVVDSGLSLVAENGHEEAYLIRAFASVEERDALEDAFYGGETWRNGPRAAVLACIESYHTIVLDGGVLGGTGCRAEEDADGEARAHGDS